MGYVFAAAFMCLTFPFFFVACYNDSKSDPHFISEYGDILGVFCKYNSEYYSIDALCIRGFCRKVFEVNPHINRYCNSL